MIPAYWGRISVKWYKTKQKVRRSGASSKAVRAQQPLHDEIGEPFSPHTPPERGAPQDHPIGNTSAKNEAAHTGVPALGNALQQSTKHNGSPATVDTIPSAEDVWSKAYMEAVQSLGDEVDDTLLKGDNINALFLLLKQRDEAAIEGSPFRRGLKHLHSLRVPLDSFKLALDIASPFANIEPSASIAFGVVRAATALAVTVASADLDFAKTIGEMLEHISYIDGCDTLGQKTGHEDMHEKSGFKFLSLVLLNTHGLPDIVQEFIRHTSGLQRIIDKATLEIAEDIKIMLHHQRIDQWLEASNYTAQSQFHDGIKTSRTDAACVFILDDIAFLDWFQTSTTRQLVVVGGMGTGKTHLIGFMVDELDRRKNHRLPQSKICSHYCHNGDDETCKAKGVLTTLILALLKQLPWLQKKYIDWHQKAQEDSPTLPSASFHRLGQFLEDTIESLDRTVYFVIDGLDECDEHSQTLLVQFFAKLSAKEANVKVLFSTRPHEAILKQFGPEVAKVDLISNEKRNMLIANKIVNDKLHHLPPDTGQMVAQRLALLSEGVAIWMDKMADLIQVKKIHCTSSIDKFLKHVPLAGDMSRLYAELLRRYTAGDPENMIIAIKALEITAIARRPLTVLELSCAVAMAVADEPFTTLAALAETMDFQRVMTLINPFIRVVNFDDLKKRQVQLAHLSVRDFMLQGSNPLVTNQPQSSLTIKAHTAQRIADLEAEMTSTCISYLLINDFGSQPLFSETQAAIEALPQETDLFIDHLESANYNPHVSWEVWEEDATRYDPSERGFGDFFVYASTYWISHIGFVPRVDQIGLERIHALCKAGSLRLRNWIEQNRRPDCAIQPRFVFDDWRYDPLSLICLYGSEALVKDLLHLSRCAGGPYLPDSGINAVEQVLMWGDVGRLGVLLASGQSGELKLDDFEFFRRAMWQWRHANDSIVRDWDAVFGLLDSIPDAVVAGDWGERLLAKAKGLDCQPMVQRLEEKGKSR